MRRLYRTAAAVALALSIAAGVSAQPDTPYVWITPPPGNIAVGQEFIATVHVSGASGVYGVSFTISYDPQTLQVVLKNDEAIQPGSFFAGQPAFTLRNRGSSGVIEYALTLTQPAEPVNGGGTLGTIAFRALAAGASAVTPLEARLLVPSFTEVSGQRVAFEINEVPAQTQAMTLNIHTSGAALNPAAPADIISPPAEALAPQPTLPVLLVGALLFLAGLALFVLSVSGYVHLRRLDTQQEGILW